MLLSFFGKTKTYKFTKTYTYFIPAPPARKKGYKEKELDHILNYILDKGFKLIDIKTQSQSQQENSGMWVIAVLGTDDLSLSQTSLDFEYLDIVKDLGIQSEDYVPLDPDIIHDA